jgi:2-amino-4-hydroxy-6-hydroxymethyldihydropteridine diphosphokinase
MARALVALGANLGEREQTLAAAVQQLAAAPGIQLLTHSNWLSTAPVGGPAGQATFLNGAALLETTLSPPELLDALLNFEVALGRHRAERWAARSLDLDLLLFDQQVILSEALEVPHPGLAFRRFMLEPAAQIAAHMRHPRIGWTLGQLVDHLNTSANYLALAGGEPAFRASLAAEVARQTGATLVSDPTALPVQSKQQALELIESRRQKLAFASGSAPERLVSDFWWLDFPSLLAKLTPADAETSLTAWRIASDKVRRPRLLVTLDLVTLDNEVALYESARKRTTSQPTSGASASAILSQPNSGPFLHIKPRTSLARAAIEVAAALDAMQ